ncbi:MAG: dihydroxy-acid dehydratase [Galbitalea sp.]
MHDGDLIRVDIAARSLDLLVEPEELEARRNGWAPPPSAVHPRRPREVLQARAFRRPWVPSPGSSRR